jgi:ubiquinone/menaquinone biosynthesis C-methylase UbiE
MIHANNDLKDAIRRSWDSNSKDYDELYGHAIKTEEERDAWKGIFKELLPANTSMILDVGCGTGELSLVLAEMGYNVRGIDLSEKMVEKSRSKAKKMNLNAKFSQGDAEDLNIGDGTFDFVFNRHLFWTLPHPKKALLEWNRVLREDGLVTVIDGKWRDGSIESRIRRLLSDLAIVLVDHENPRKGWYNRSIESSLPHPTGLSPEEAMDYLKSTKFKEINYKNLDQIMELQKMGMPFKQKVLVNWSYYLVKGIK